MVLGLCVGFLPHNFHPARIFMGDGGAYLLGLLMAASTIMVGGRTDAEFSGQTFFFFAPLLIPLLILGVPIVDTLFAIVRRATKRQGLATADKDHLHHRLMRLGHGQRRSVLILWAWTALLSFFVLYPTYTGKGDAIVPIGVLALGLILYTLFHPGLRGRAQREQRTGTGPTGMRRPRAGPGGSARGRTRQRGPERVGAELAGREAPHLDCERFHKLGPKAGTTPTVDASQRRELNKGLGDGFTRAFEIVLAPAIFGLLGLAVDRALGTVPAFTTALAVLALTGVFVKTYYVYAEQMRQHEEGRPWARSR